MIRQIATAMGALFFSHAVALGQATSGRTDDAADRAPRFLLASARADEAPKRLDVDRTPSLSRRIAVELDGVRLREAINTVAARAGFQIVYSTDDIKADAVVQLSAQNITVAAALTDILAGTGVDVVFDAWGGAALVRRLVPRPKPSGTIVGRVTDVRTDRPLAQATLELDRTQLTATTSADGRYRIANVPPGNYNVVARHIGYSPSRKSVSVADGQEATVDFALDLLPTSLNAIVVTGTPDAAQVRSLGNVVERLPVASIVDATHPATIQQILTTQTPGLVVSAAGGAVGVGGNTRIRGVGSLMLSAEPLVYVDGIRVDNNPAYGSAGFNRGDRPSRINDLNPDEIESIEVIKGPSAATIYGTEASNGVIQIVTKRGALAQPQWASKVSYGSSYLYHPQDVYPSIAWGINPANNQVRSYNVLADPNAPKPFTTGHPNSVNLNLTGGADAIRYFLSGGFDHQTGIVDYNWQNKLSGRLNLDYNSNKWNIGASLGMIQQRTRSPDVAQPITYQLVWNQFNGIGDPRLQGWRAHPPGDYEILEGFETLLRSTAGVTVEHSTFSWLKQRLRFGGDIGDVNGSALYPRDPLGDRGPWAGQSLGQITVSADRTTNNTLDYSASATFPLLSDLESASTFGAQYQRKLFENQTAQGLVFPAPGVETVSAAATRFGTQTFIESKTLGMYVQEQFSWLNRRFLTLALRGDDNSAFGSEFKFVAYPKISGSWVISEEPFWHRLPALDELRLRSAWGKAGQQPDVFAALRLLSPSVGPAGSATLTMGSPGNPNLKPEVGEELEMGLDVSAFDRRLDVAFTHYDKRTKDAIVPSVSLPSLGFPQPRLVNLGEISNTGTETAVHYHAIRRPTLGWDLGLNYATAHNKVINDGGAPGGDGIRSSTRTDAGWQRDVVGFPIQAIFMPKVVHAEFDATGKLVNVLCEGGNPITGGGPGVPCNQAGTAYYGPVTPTWLGSASTTLRLGNLSLFALTDFQGGFYRIDGDVYWAHRSPKNTEAAVKRTDPILTAILETPVAGFQPGTIKGGFAKLRNLSANYILPPRFASQLRGSKASVTLSAENLATLWLEQKGAFGRKQVDPEVRANQDPMSAYNMEKWPTFTRLLATISVTY